MYPGASGPGWTESPRAGHLEAVVVAVFSPNGKLVLTASSDYSAGIWEVATGRLPHILDGHTGSIKTAVFSSDGKKVVTASSDNTAKIWDVATGKLLHTL